MLNLHICWLEEIPDNQYQINRKYWAKWPKHFFFKKRNCIQLWADYDVKVMYLGPAFAKFEIRKF